MKSWKNIHETRFANNPETHSIVKTGQGLAGFAEKIRFAKAAEIEAGRAYYKPPNEHDCV